MNLDEKLHEAGSIVDMLRNAPQGPYIYPMRAEYTNWRDEQQAWQNTAVLFDQSHHMTDIYFKGPDALKLMSDLGVNGFRNFGRNKAKQFVACNHDGYFIGDAILFAFEDDEFSLVGRPVAPNWAAFHAETGNYRVSVTRDERSVANEGKRLTFRFQLNGPATHAIVEKAAGLPLPRIRFFAMGEFEIAGVPVRALNHTMVGIPGQEFTGLELVGPSEHSDTVHAALVAAGEEFGLRQGGARAYPSTALESGWIPAPVPALYTGESMRPFRTWLSGTGFEASASIGGSFVSNDIEDYYVTPWDLGYGHLIKFDHDFIGRAALEQKVTQAHRRKVWLRWNDRDTSDLIADSLFGAGPRAKYLEMPVSNYATGTYDKVLVAGRMVGISANNGYTVNVGGWSSLAMVDETEAIDGREVTIVIGEENGGSAKPTVERHVQRHIRATLRTDPLV
ncbi:aminomethyl transferase family protein [Streptomyces sp. NPDC127036]|uniref:aminomethyl transferase family protein n=1 Tax=Streptomyces sp. NPDC127036 TaxID=3347112 RepID=UPI0036482997